MWNRFSVESSEDENIDAPVMELSKEIAKGKEEEKDEIVVVEEAKDDSIQYEVQIEGEKKGTKKRGRKSQRWR